MKNWLRLLIGIQFGVLGIILNARTGLGVASFASTFYAFSQLTSFSLGMSSMIVYITLILLQIILLKKVTISLLLQIPFSIVFSIITDVYNMFIPSFSLSLFGRIFLVIIACFVTALGIYLQVSANLITSPVEGIVKVITDITDQKFGLVKNLTDLTMVLLTLIICFCFHLPIQMIGIGTILSVILIGRFVQIHSILFSKFSSKLMRA